MVEVVFNLKSKKDKEQGKKYKVLTFHVLKDHLDSVVKLLKITQKPTLQKKVDLMTTDVRNMVEYQNDETPIETNPSFKIIFVTDEDRDYFSELIKIKVLPTTRSMWFPERPKHDLEGMMYVVDEPVKTKYPIYILSKGRWEQRHTSKTLEEMNVDYKIVVEPQEYEEYSKVISKDKILILPDEYLNKDQGGIPCRNFIWEHSVQQGHKSHWIIDDNIEGFFRWNRNKKLPLKSGICFKMIEDYFDSCSNVGMCGIQYSSFYPEISLRRPIVLKNTRIYSCILIKNDIDKEVGGRWRGKYNEDTDLSLRMLKKGYGTLLFQNFLCGKKTTLSVKGGNSQIYSGDGLQKKLDSLISQHPDVTKGTIKFGKVHHQVNYKPFKDNKIIFNKTTFPKYPEIKLVKNPKHVEEVVVEEEEEDDQE